MSVEMPETHHFVCHTIVTQDLVSTWIFVDSMVYMILSLLGYLSTPMN